MKSKQMKNHNVRHYLGIYTTRKDMQEKGITNPTEQIKQFTSQLVEKLQNLPLDDEIILKDNAFFDSSGNLILKFPD
jgi:hypothetical protein